jgi:hypothetical protein
MKKASLISEAGFYFLAESYTVFYNLASLAVIVSSPEVSVTWYIPLLKDSMFTSTWFPEFLDKGVSKTFRPTLSVIIMEAFLFSKAEGNWIVKWSVAGFGNNKSDCFNFSGLVPVITAFLKKL